MSATAELTEERVLEVLRTVKFPGLSRDIVAFGFVKDLSVGGGNVAMRLEITTESTAAAEEIRRDATEKRRAGRRQRRRPRRSCRTCGSRSPSPRGRAAWASPPSRPTSLWPSSASAAESG
jgi:Iron-sulfur cluster assembly protein